MKKIIFILCIFSATAKAQTYKQLALEGGGVRGLAYAGAIKVLEEKQVLQGIEKVAGTSVGSIAALMLCVGYDAKEIDSIMRDLQIEKFNDGGFGIIGKLKRFKKEYGIYKGEAFDLWLGQLIESKTNNADISFAELHQLHLNDKKFKDLYCTGSNITQQRLESFSFVHTPNMSIKTAVHISSCIPLYFKPVAIDSTGKMVKKIEKGQNYQLYVDGGLICNYPINMFDSCANGGNPLTCDKVFYNPTTLGLKLERPEQIDSFKQNNLAIPPFQINSMNDYLTAFANLTLETLNRKTPNMENEKGRTIYISYGHVSSQPHKTNDDEKLELFNNGVLAANLFFDQLKNSAATFTH
jgi:NTE family protein